MARGGKRENAGRKPGSVPSVTAYVRRKALASGVSPLEYMLRVMRNTKADERRRDEMAKAAAPFVHAKLASMEHKGSVGTYDLTKVDHADLDRLETILRSASVTGGGDSGEAETRH
jgi:hypothetical protein